MKKETKTLMLSILLINIVLVDAQNFIYAEEDRLPALPSPTPNLQNVRLSVIGYRLKPPKFDNDVQYVVIPEGLDAKIRCQGVSDVEIRWEHPDIANTDNDQHERFEVTEVSTDFTEELAFSQDLIITNITFWDTGLITCRSTGGEWMTRIYLFVESDTNLFRNSRLFNIVNVYTNLPSPIGCRPTSPHVEMKFLNAKSQDITDKLDSLDMRYTPQTGLWLTRADLSDAGAVHCIARIGDTEQKYVAFLKIIKRNETSLPKPRTSEPEPKNPEVGEQFSLSCNISVSDDDYQKGVNLTWMTPNANMEKDITDGRVVIGNTTSIRAGDSMVDLTNYRMIKRNLTVYNLRNEDTGVYTCIATADHISTNSSQSTFVKVLSRGGVYIGDFHFSGAGSEVRVRKSKDLIEWHFNIDVFPKDQARYSWYLPSGDQVKDDQLVKYHKNINSQGHISVSIKDVDIHDMGSYTFTVTVEGSEGNISRSQSLELVVFQDPVVNMSVKDYHYDFYKPMDFYDVSCETVGYPVDPLDKDTLSLRFYPCSSFTECDYQNGESFTAGMLEPLDGVLDPKFHYKFISTTRVQARKSGKFECRVCTKRQAICQVSYLNFFLSESKEGLEIRSNYGDYLVELDFLDLTCVASQYLYSRVFWTRHGRYLESSQLTTEANIYATIQKEEVTMSDDGAYVCNAVRKYDNTSVGKEVMVKVEQMRSPVILDTLGTSFNNVDILDTLDTFLNNSEIVLSAGDSIYLSCAVSGLPRPEIEWKKDSVPIHSDHFEVSKNISDNDTTLVEIRLAYLTGEESGNYTCTGTNRAGAVTAYMDISVLEPISNTVIYLSVGGILGGMFLILAISYLSWHIWIYKKKIRMLTAAELQLFEKGDPDSINPELSVDEQVDLLPFNKETFEFPKSRLKLGTQIGSGAFGRVLKAEAAGINSWEPVSTVAVKMVKPHADITYIKALMSELKIMSHLGKHLNIVNLLGACTDNLNARKLYVIVEYCRFGNLQKYLIRHRNSFINQIEPESGVLDFNIGKLVRGDNMEEKLDYAREREMYEVSAHYVKTSNVDRSVSQVEGANSEGYLEMRSPLQNSVNFDRQFSTRTEAGRQDNYAGEGELVSDMTNITQLTDSYKNRSSRTYSVNSGASKTGPGWRSNVRGDYRSQETRPITTKDLICWAFQVARGMEYLSRRKVMHGDLACRNILLAADNVVKICDFGLAKDVYKTNNYQKKSDGPLPVKWLAIECLRDRIFSTQSDVWAFGIVLWEMFSLGKTPYPGMEAGERFYEVLSKGYRMPKPQFAPRDIYKIMLDCWNSEPVQRPRFLELTGIFGDFLEEGEKENYILMGERLENTNREGSGYLNMMTAPDYQNIVANHIPEHNGYLIPTSLSRLKEEDEFSHGPENENLITAQVEVENGYLVPDKQKDETDGGGYLIPTKSPDQAEEDQQENNV